MSFTGAPMSTKTLCWGMHELISGGKKKKKQASHVTSSLFHVFRPLGLVSMWSLTFRTYQVGSAATKNMESPQTQCYGLLRYHLDGIVFLDYICLLRKGLITIICWSHACKVGRVYLQTHFFTRGRPDFIVQLGKQRALSWRVFEYKVPFCLQNVTESLDLKPEWIWITGDRSVDTQALKKCGWHLNPPPVLLVSS